MITARMFVKIFDVDNNTGAELLRTESADLRECFPDVDDPEYHEARRELERAGRYWGGGGAAPRYLLMRA